MPRVREAPSEVKIAMLVPLSGPWARQGILEQMGARMAIDDINSAGGIKSMGGAKLKLVEYDTQDSAEKAKDGAQRMLAAEPDLGRRLRLLVVDLHPRRHRGDRAEQSCRG